jgi:hypothetical protein
MLETKEANLTQPTAWTVNSPGHLEGVCHTRMSLRPQLHLQMGAHVVPLLQIQLQQSGIDVTSHPAVGLASSSGVSLNSMHAHKG